MSALLLATAARSRGDAGQAPAQASEARELSGASGAARAGAAAALEGAKAGARSGIDAPDMTYANQVPVTRAGLVWRLLGRPSMNAESVMREGFAKGWLTQPTRPLAPVSRAEAAVMLVSFAGVAGAAFKGLVYYFADVPAGSAAWIFEAAHRARLFGIFRGTTENCFQPGNTLDGATAEELCGRARGAVLQAKAAQKSHLTVEPLSEPSSWVPYPGPAASDEAKHAFYLQVLARTGHGGVHDVAPGRYSLIGIRGFRQGDLAEMKYNGNAANEYNDLLVVIGQDEAGKAVIEEFPGSTEPGVAKQWALQAGVYRYAYEGQRFTSTSGARVDGSYFRMVAGRRDFDTIRDANGDGRYDLEGGDTAARETNNRSYLIHKGGADPSAKVGAWSYGCQVFAGTTGGRANVDVAADYLRKSPDEVFDYILIDGRALEAAAVGR